jgi:hypothetical protein
MNWQWENQINCLWIVYLVLDSMDASIFASVFAGHIGLPSGSGFEQIM